MSNSGPAAITALGIQISTLIACLHRAGVLPIETVIEEMQESSVNHAVRFQDEQVKLQMALYLRGLTQLSERLKPFDPKRHEPPTAG